MFVCGRFKASGTLVNQGRFTRLISLRNKAAFNPLELKHRSCPTFGRRSSLLFEILWVACDGLESASAFKDAKSGVCLGGFVELSCQFCLMPSLWEMASPTNGLFF